MKTMKSYGWLRSSLLLGVVLLIGAMALSGCSLPREADAKGDGEAESLVEKAIDDLADRLGISPDEVTLKSVEATDFSDTSLGVPEPGQMYAGVITPGYVIELTVDGETYVYHGSDERVVFVPDTADPGDKAPGGLPPLPPEPGADLLPELLLLVPDFAEAVDYALVDLDGDCIQEAVLLTGAGGAPEEGVYDFLDLFVMTSTSEGFELAWHSGQLDSERADPLLVEDTDGDGDLDVVSVQYKDGERTVSVLDSTDDGYELVSQ